MYYGMKDENFGRPLIPTNMTKGHGGALIPISDLQENLAINQAIQLSMSQLIKDGNYVFSNCRCPEPTGYQIVLSNALNRSKFWRCVKVDQSRRQPPWWFQANAARFQSGFDAIGLSGR